MNANVRYGQVGLILFTALTVGIVVCVTLLIWLAANGRSVLAVFPFSAGAWGSYLCAHYVVEGEFTDKSGTGESGPETTVEDSSATFSGHGDLLPSSRARRVFAAVGVGGMLLTFPTGILAVGGDDVTLMLVSATLFVGGYVVGHHGFTGKPL